MTESDPVPHPGPPARWPTVVAWVVILACVGLIVVAGFRPRAVAVPDVAPEAHASTDVLMQSRIAVGIHTIVRRLGAGAAGAGGAAGPAGAVNNGAPLAEGVEQAATSPLGKLRAVPAVAELLGADAAVARLDALRDGGGGLPEGLRPDVDSLRAIYADGPATLGEPRRAALVARHGWFARLALAHDMPEDDPARRAALAPAVRAAVAMFAMLGGMLLGGVLGLALLIAALVAGTGGRLRPAYVPPGPGRAGPFAEAFAVYLLGIIVGSALIAWLLPDATFAANWLLALALPPALAWPWLRGVPWPEVRAGFGWHRGRGWLREAAAGVAGYVAAVPLLVLAVVLTTLLVRLSGITPSHPISQEVGAGGLPHTLQLYLLAAAYAPLVEETLFRGAFYHHCRRRLPWWLAALVVGVLFAAIHPQGWVGIPMLTTIALVFAALREWRGSIVAPVVCHACVNGVTMTMLVLMTA